MPRMTLKVLVIQHYLISRWISMYENPLKMSLQFLIRFSKTLSKINNVVKPGVNVKIPTVHMIAFHFANSFQYSKR